MLYFFLASLTAYIAVSCTKNTKENNKEAKYPTGVELINRIRVIPQYEWDISSLNIALIEPYIFRDYVYNYEKNSRIYTRNSN